MDHVSLLPKQVAVNIFRFVDLQDLVNCSRVCRTWKEITQATVLWSRVFILLFLFILECVFPFFVSHRRDIPIFIILSKEFVRCLY